jgi:hypothetical protein
MEAERWASPAGGSAAGASQVHAGVRHALARKGFMGPEEKFFALHFLLGPVVLGFLVFPLWISTHTA